MILKALRKISNENVHTFLEYLYRKYNHRRFVAPDPLQFLYNYHDPLDREVVGFIAAVLAYGRVGHIVKKEKILFERLGQAPATFLISSSLAKIQKAVSGIRHRFTGEHEIAALLHALSTTIRKHGSLFACFQTCLIEKERTLEHALNRFVEHISSSAPVLKKFTLPQSHNGSACKRLNLFLRWMVRRDEVDLGDWHNLGPSLLMVPLDIHMFRIGHALSFTKRRQADIVAAREITEGFKMVCPEDPVRYDFVLTRFGLRSDFQNLEV